MDNIHGTEYALFMVLMIHVIMAPYTKVEESFNVQAIHDILYHRGNLSEYDHNEFPGVVPRTFTGPVLIGVVLMPLVPIFSYFQVEKYVMLFAARFLLGGTVILMFGNFARCVENHFGKETGEFLRLIVISQFHFMFYASRPLPNTFALILVIWVYRLWLDEKYSKAICIATIAAFLFRFELILLFGPLFLPVFFQGKVSIFRAIGLGIAVLSMTLLITVPIDSLFWNRLVWPEGEVIWFNVVLNKSPEWGTLPFAWYFYSAIPRALLTSLVLIPLGLWFDRRITSLVFPVIVFVFIYSFLPHKELRFIIYAFPILNVPAAVFCARMWINRDKSLLRKLIAWGTAAHLLANLLLSGMFLYASAMNYPSGDALAHLQFKHRYIRSKPVSVYIDIFSAMNGVNKFLHLYPAWEYYKERENETESDLSRFDYILLGSATGDVRNAAKNFTATHKEYFTVDAFLKIVYRRFFNNILPYPIIRFKEKVIVLKKLN